MTARRPRLIRSIPFWALIVGSVASGAVGLWLTLDKLGVMTTTLTDGSATGVEVYVGQSWAVLGSIMIGAGLVGLALALVLAAASSLVRTEEPAIVVIDEVEEIDEIDEPAYDEPAVDDVPETEAVAATDEAPATR